MPYSPRMRRLLGALLLIGLVVGLGSEGGTARAEEEHGATYELRVVSARIRPLRADGRAWDADHRMIPNFVYRHLAGLGGYPTLGLLALVPYRNRPDPYVVARVGDAEGPRSDAAQGTFLPRWDYVLHLPRVDDPPPITLVVRDDDVEEDDEVGRVVVDVATLLATPGPHVVPGEGGVTDLLVVVRTEAGPEVPVSVVQITRVRITARAERPSGGTWDAGIPPALDRLRRLPGVPDPGITVQLPDLVAKLLWSTGEERESSKAGDSTELDWTDVAFSVKGRLGYGDGLYVDVADKDLVLDDPVGTTYIPLERFVEERETGVLVQNLDERSGLAQIEVSFTVE